MSKDFRFAKSQRLIVPGKKHEGIVVGRCDYVDRECEFQLRWFSAAGAKCEQWFGEAQLTEAQPAPAPPVNDLAGITRQVRPARSVKRMSKISAKTTR